MQATNIAIYIRNARCEKTGPSIGLIYMVHAADGSLKLWDLNSRDPFPIANFHEHTQEAASVDWNLVRKDQFVSASWDSSIKLWNPMQSNASIATYMEHTGSVYNAQWSPRQPNVFLSCASDGTCKIWDTNQPRSTCTVNAHQGEVWNISSVMWACDV
jgi:peroxin-7